MKRSLLAIVAVVVIVVAIAAAWMLMSGNDDQSDDDPSDYESPPEGEIPLQLNETEIFHIQGEDVAFTYEGEEGLNIAVMQNGYPDNGFTFAVSVDENWSSYQGFSSYYGYDITFEFRVVTLTSDNMTFEIREA